MKVEFTDKKLYNNKRAKQWIEAVNKRLNSNLVSRIGSKDCINLFTVKFGSVVIS